MKATALWLLLLCATLAGCVVVPDGDGWYHDHDWHYDHDWHHDRR